MYQTLPKLPAIMAGDIVNIPFLVVDENGADLDLTGATELVAKLFAVGGNGLPDGAALVSDNLAGGVDIDDAEGGEDPIVGAVLVGIAVETGGGHHEIAQ